MFVLHCIKIIIIPPNSLQMEYDVGCEVNGAECAMYAYKCIIWNDVCFKIRNVLGVLDKLYKMSTPATNISLQYVKIGYDEMINTAWMYEDIIRPLLKLDAGDAIPAMQDVCNMVPVIPMMDVWRDVERDNVREWICDARRLLRSMYMRMRGKYVPGVRTEIPISTSDITGRN